MNNNEDSNNNGEFETAVAAAAFAINSLIEEDPKNQKKIPESSLSNVKSKIEDIKISQPDSGRISRRFSFKLKTEDKQSQGEASMKKPEELDSRVPESLTTTGKMLEKAIGSLPSMKKTKSFSDQLNETSSAKPETAPDKKQPPYPPPQKQPSPSRTGEKSTETKADAWEKEKMDRINKRFEKLSSEILSWENKKKTKAKRRLTRKERELESRRVRALQKYNTEVSMIDKIAGGARAEAEKSRRKDESNVKEKAKKIRSTGKVPVTCFCF